MNKLLKQSVPLDEIQQIITTKVKEREKKKAKKVDTSSHEFIEARRKKVVQLFDDGIDIVSAEMTEKMKEWEDAYFA